LAGGAARVAVGVLAVVVVADVVAATLGVVVEVEVDAADPHPAAPRTSMQSNRNCRVGLIVSSPIRSWYS
jgi:hypothetical protein